MIKFSGLRQHCLRIVCLVSSLILVVWLSSTVTPTATSPPTLPGLPSNTLAMAPAGTVAPAGMPLSLLLSGWRVYLPVVVQEWQADLPSPTPAATPTNTPTATPTNTPTATPTNTPTATPTNTPTPTPTDTPTPTPTPTDTPTPTPSRSLDEIVRGIRILASKMDWGTECDKFWPPPYWAYYESEAFLDHGFGSTYKSYYTYELNGAGRIIAYRVRVQGSTGSFVHRLEGIPTASNILDYTGSFTSTHYDSFTYRTTLSYSSGWLVGATVVKNYGNGETYRIKLDIDRYLIYPIAERYTATVNGPGYSGATRTVDDIEFRPSSLFCN